MNWDRQKKKALKRRSLVTMPELSKPFRSHYDEENDEKSSR